MTNLPLLHASSPERLPAAQAGCIRERLEVAREGMTNMVGGVLAMYPDLLLPEEAVPAAPAKAQPAAGAVIDLASRQAAEPAAEPKNEQEEHLAAARRATEEALNDEPAA